MTHEISYQLKLRSWRRKIPGPMVEHRIIRRSIDDSDGFRLTIMSSTKVCHSREALCGRYQCGHSLDKRGCMAMHVLIVSQGPCQGERYNRFVYQLAQGQLSTIRYSKKAPMRRFSPFDRAGLLRYFPLCFPTCPPLWCPWCT